MICSRTSLARCIAVAAKMTETPPAELERVAGLILQVAQRPDTRKFYAALNIREARATPADLRRRQVTKIAQLRGLATQLKIPLQQ